MKKLECLVLSMASIGYDRTMPDIHRDFRAEELDQAPSHDPSELRMHRIQIGQNEKGRSDLEPMFDPFNRVAGL